MITGRYFVATKTSAAILCMAAFLAGYTSISLASDSGLRDSLLSCSKVENNVERLECVDQLILSIANQPAAESITRRRPPETATEKLATNDSSASELGQKDLTEPQKATAQTSLSHNLIAAYKDDKERWNFELDNGEVWQQIEPRYLPRLESLPVPVSISNGVFGSHDLRAENFGKAVKVRRLN